MKHFILLQGLNGVYRRPCLSLLRSLTCKHYYCHVHWHR